MALWWLRMAVIIWLLPLVRNPPVHFYIVSRAEKKAKRPSVTASASNAARAIKASSSKFCRAAPGAAVPRVSEMLLGRALVAAHAHRVRALIVLNKTDLEAAARVARARLDLYRSLGYTALEISAKTQPEAARSQLEIRLKHQITLLLGPSGTGKSTLVNLLAPGAQAKTQEISTALRTGKHTT